MRNHLVRNYLVAAILIAGFAFLMISSGCYMSNLLAGPNWSENYALASYGTKASSPAINDGKYETEAVVPPSDEVRSFQIQLPEIKEIRRIVIYNSNLHWFDIYFWNYRTNSWQPCAKIRSRHRESSFSRAQEKYDLSQLRFSTDRLRIEVIKTVDDTVKDKIKLAPGDKVIGSKYKTIFDYPVWVHQVLIEQPARLREIEVYGLAETPAKPAE